MSKTDDILTAAIECFTNYGYNKTTMSDIGSRVGMNKASLYYHYQDKLSLYKAVLGKLNAEHRKIVDTALVKCSSIESEIITFLNFEIDFWANIAINPQFSPSCDTEDRSQVVEQVLANQAMVLKEILDRGIKNESFKSMNTLEKAKEILEISGGLLAINCPMNLPLAQHKEGYDIVKFKVTSAISTYLTGLK